MKKNILFILFLSAGSIVLAQKNIPDTIKAAFSKKFPTASNVKWGLEEDEQFEAKFTLNGKKFSANFFPNGNWKETEVELSQNDVPPLVLTSFKKNHKNVTIRSIEKTATSTGKNSYEFKYKEGTRNKEVQYDEMGNILKD